MDAVCPDYVEGNLTEAATTLAKQRADAAQVADLWANSHSCDSHDYDPCCHVRTGKAIAEAIRVARAGEVE